VLRRLATTPLQPRAGGAGRISPPTGDDAGTLVRLVPSDQGSTVRTAQGSLHLPGFRLELASRTRGTRGMRGHGGTTARKGD
jgi:hypothetical protein